VPLDTVDAIGRAQRRWTTKGALHDRRLRDQHGPGSSLDNFIIDNVVLFFKTRASGPVIGGVKPGG
jgi:hypothetical protein